MATLEELVIQLTAETKDLRTDLNKATKAVATSSDKMEKSIDEFSKGSSKSLSMFQNAMSTAAGFLASQAVLGAFNGLKRAAGALFETFISDGIQAAQAQEDAINKLNTALALSGQYSKSTSQELQEYASSLQAVTKYGDETVLETAALVQSLGGLEKDGLKRATTATVDLAAALGIDLKAAATLVGKAATGEISSFTRYGVVIEKGATSAETFTNALTALESKFGGTAANQVKTFSGTLQQTENTFGDLTETVGFTVTQNQALVSVMSELEKTISGVNSEIGSNNEHYKQLVGEGIVAVLDSTAAMITVFDAVMRAASAFADGVESAFGQIGKSVTAMLSVFDDSFNETYRAFEMQTNEAAMNFTKRFTEDTMLGDAATKFLEFGDAARKGLEEMKRGVEAGVEPTNQMVEKVTELTAAEQKRADATKKFAEDLALASENVKSIYDSELEALQLNLEEKLITEEEFWALRLEKLAEYQEQEQAQLQAALNQGLISEEQYKKAVSKLDKQQDAEKRKMILDRKKFEEAQNKLRLQGYSTFFAGLSALSESSNKHLAAIGKASAISKATIDAYLAIQNALANVPYPANIAAAAGIGVQAFANVSKIAGVALNKGGTLSGRGANVDSVPATLTPGETVITRDTTDRLARFLENQEMGQAQTQNIRIELSMNEQAAEMFEATILERQRLGVSLIKTRLA